MSREIILACFGINLDDVSDYLEHYNEEDETFHFFIKFHKSTKHCPHCGSIAISTKAYYKVVLNASTIHNKKCVAHLKIRRYICYDCKKTFKEDNQYYEKYSTILNSVKNSIIEDLKKRVSYTYIANQYNVSLSEVIKIFDEIPKISRQILPSVLCVDEFHFSNDANKDPRYPFVMSNPYNSEIIDIVEYRKKDVLFDYFSSISRFERSNVRYFISDMNRTYKKIKAHFFPNSIHIIDHFHIIKAFNDSIHIVRRNLLNEYKNEKKHPLYISLKKNWKFFLMPRHKLLKLAKVGDFGITYDFLNVISETFRHFSDLGLLYYAREEFTQEMIKMKNSEETTNFFNFFIKKHEDSTCKSLQNLIKTLKNWKTEIIAAYAKNDTGFYLTNAIAESNNNKIQTYVNVSFGLTNFQRFRNRVLFMNIHDIKKRGF